MNHAPFIQSEYEILKSNKIIKGMTQRFNASLVIEHKDRFGKLKESREVPFESFVSNFARILNYGFGNVGNNNKLTKTDGTKVATSRHQMDVSEGALISPTQSNYGMWIGNITGDAGITLGTPNGDIGGDPAFEDYDLYNQFLADGGSPDTGVVYGATNVYVDSGTVLRVTRRFTNDSGSSIKISEVGLIGSDSTDYFMICRDSINPSIVLVNQDIVDISYKFSVTSNSGFTKNFLRMLSSSMDGNPALENLTDYSGTSSPIDFSSGTRTDFDLLASAGVDTHGILIGGANNAIPTVFTYSTDSYRLRSQLSDSVISHGAVIATNLNDVTKENGYSKIGYYRDFENTGTTPIYINEAALVINNATESVNVLISRIPITNTSSVPYVIVQPGEVFRLKYYLAFPVETYVDAVREIQNIVLD